MTEPAPRASARARRRARLGGAALLVTTAATAVLWLPRAAPPDAGPRGREPAPRPTSPAAAGVTGPAATAAATAPHDRVVAPPAGAAQRRTFAQFVAELVALGAQTTALVAADDHDAAAAIDATSRALFATMLAELPDAPEQALRALTGTPRPADPTDVRGHLQRRVWNLALGSGLQLRHATAPARTAALVGAMLTAMPAAVALAEELGTGHLADRPYLAAAHEASVLELVAMSGEGAFPTDVATALLSTLWDNLQRSGARTTAELSGLALLLVHDGNASERASAARLLLADDRYRLVLLQHVVEHEDRSLAREIATVAAQDLPPQLALDVLEQTVHLTDGFVPPFLTLGHREPGLLQRAYERRLADDVAPRLREALVAGAGFGADPGGVEVARLAQRADPDPDVRLRALFVLSAQRPAALGEAAFASALDDPAIRDSPRRLGAVVLALQNLAHAGLVNEVDRIGRRLGACGLLPAPARAQLEQILAEALPRGGSR